MTRKKTKQSKQFKQPDLSPYAGEWVAILRDKVIAHSKNIDDIAKYVVRDSRDKTPIEKVPALFKVPRPDEGPYILFICPK